MEYQKINTLFLRDEKKVIIPSSFTCDEFEYLKDCKWECTEKIDGTNIRIYISREYDGEDDWLYGISFMGRTNDSTIPEHLNLKLQQIFYRVDWKTVFPSLMPGDSVCLYGEGYGNKIQKGSSYISNDVDFILFDVKYNNWWLERKNCEDIANKCGIKIVPIVGYMTIPEAIDLVKKGFKSSISEDKNLIAEGLVLKTPQGLLSRDGKRIITKIKHNDFVKFKNVYGQDF
jgi:ATP-dependent RNA circularization protein (DNA/RNA ligase family)